MRWFKRFIRAPIFLVILCLATFLGLATFVVSDLFDSTITGDLQGTVVQQPARLLGIVDENVGQFVGSSEWASHTQVWVSGTTEDHLYTGWENRVYDRHATVAAIMLVTLTGSIVGVFVYMSRAGKNRTPVSFRPRKHSALLA